LYADGRDSRLPRDTTLEFDWTRYRGELRGAYLQYRQELAPEWTVKFNAAGWRNEAELAYGYFRRPINPVTNAVNERPIAISSVGPNVQKQKTADLTLTGTLNWFGRREEVAVGTDFTRVEVRSDNDNYPGFGALLGDPRAFDPRDYPDPRLTELPDAGTATSTTHDQYGAFASLRVYFNNAWSIVGGARISGDSTDTQFTLRDIVIPSRSFAESYGTNHVVTPYAGLMYSFDRHYSAYASYSDIYLAQTGLPERTPGHLLEPIRGVNVEAGIKGEWRSGALNGLMAVYRIEQSNLPRPIGDTTAGQPGVRNCCFTGVTSESRGVDVEISGAPAPRWTLGAGYTYNENESPDGEALAIFAPKHLLKAWSTVRLPGAFNRWQIGGSLVAQSETATHTVTCSGPPTFACGPVDGVQPTYAVLDLRASFDVDQNWQLALSVDNVLDKSYYELSDDSSLYVWYGEPRKWMLRVDGRY
jgi:outer-membrane receptor for ferric coprogen and ferric-rhodotorulic acid